MTRPLLREHSLSDCRPLAVKPPVQDRCVRPPRFPRHDGPRPTPHLHTHAHAHGRGHALRLPGGRGAWAWMIDRWDRLRIARNPPGRKRWAAEAVCKGGPREAWAPVTADRGPPCSLRATSGPRHARLPRLGSSLCRKRDRRSRPGAAPGALLPCALRGGAVSPRVMGAGCCRRRPRASDDRVDRPVRRGPGVSLGLIASVGVLWARATRGIRASAPVTPTPRAMPFASSGPANGRMVFRGLRKP